MCLPTTVCGVNGKLLTRDESPHGTVPDLMEAPLLSIGLYDDWRDGMEEFAAMQVENGGKPAPLPTGFTPKPIAGWNSWGIVWERMFDVGP